MWRVLFVSVMALGLLGAASSPTVAQKWLVLLVDRSNSIDDRELALQRDAYVRLLSDAAVIQALADTQVAIVEFDTRPEIVVDWTDPASAARAYGQKPRDKKTTGTAEAGKSSKDMNKKPASDKSSSSKQDAGKKKDKAQDFCS